MAYVDPNFATKKAFVAAVNAGESLLIYSTGPFAVNQNGRNTVEGPHYPQPHRWYAAVVVKDGIVISAK